MTVHSLRTGSCDPAVHAPDYVRGIAPYTPGKPIADLAREFGLREADIVKLASNENPRGPGDAVRAAILRATDELSRYPDGNGFALKSALCARFGVGPDEIVLGNGSNDVLELVTQAFLTPGDAAVYSQHAFAVYPLATKARGATGIEVPADEFGHDLPAMRAAITAGDAHRVRRESEQSHRNVDRAGAAGSVHRIGARRRAYRARRGVRRVPRAGPTSRAARSWIAKHPNLVVSRTFSKAYGLAALRVGYGIMHARVADMLNRVRQPFNVNALAQAAAVAALADTAYVDESRRLNREGMRALEEGLARARSCAGCHRTPISSWSAFPARPRLPAIAARRRDRPPGRELRAARLAAGHRRTAGGEPPVPRRSRARARRLTRRVGS